VKSAHEELFRAMLDIAQVKGYTREHRFDPVRKWRFDFAFPDKKIAVEIDGGTWMKNGGRHARSADYEKRNAATFAGWKVYYYTPDMIKSGRALQQVIKSIL
jgi:very-short-patch-repair endonuclease